MMDMRKYRLNDESQLAKYQKDTTRYNRFVNRVYLFLDSLVVGESAVIADITDDQTIDLFIKVCCLYITYRNPPSYDKSYVLFNEDYTVITRYPPCIIPVRYHNNFYNDAEDK